MYLYVYVYVYVYMCMCMYVFIYLYSFCINYTGHQCKTVTLLIDLSCINKFIYLFIYSDKYICWQKWLKCKTITGTFSI